MVFTFVLGLFNLLLTNKINAVRSVTVREERDENKRKRRRKGNGKRKSKKKEKEKKKE